MNFRRVALLLPCVVFAACIDAAAQTASPSAPADTERTGEQIFKAACVSCHGPDGKGQPQAVLGFEPPATFPDFTDCAVSSPEPDYIWLAIVHRGGRIRGESHIMPAFEDALSDEEIHRVVQYLYSLCAEPRWPRGNLNFPRAFFTEKAFPENETVFTITMAPSHASNPASLEHRVDYEHRLGRRAQFEFGAPFAMQKDETGRWTRGLGDVNAALKYAFYDNDRRGTIAAAGGEVTLPTGKENEGLGGGVTIFETFGMFDQALPRDAFLQVHAGFERPKNHEIEQNSMYWRTAVGKMIKQNRWGRTWTPIVELLAAKELTSGSQTEWDLVPQMQVSLSIFQHVLFDVGVRVPINARDTRGKAVMAYLLWDWFDGGLFDLWRAH